MSFGEVYWRGGTVLLSLFVWSLFLLVIVIYFMSGIIFKMMLPWTKKALHYLRVRISYMLIGLETHIACIVLLTLL